MFLTCRAAARSMKAARAGKIITISSGAYASGRVGASHYCASKAGIVMFTRVPAMELAEQRINVNCIARRTSRRPRCSWPHRRPST